MADVLMGLGSQDPNTTDETGLILFYVPSKGIDTPNFETIQRDAQYTWTSNDRLSRDPAMQFTGPGEDNVVVEGKMYPYHFGGISTLDRMRNAGRAGKPMILCRFYPLTDPKGYGTEVIGNYVIRRVRTVEQKIGAVGIAHKIDFTLELTRYGDDLGTPTAGNDFGVL
ncbi:phage tail protein [Bradyrhizobium barranii subsp. apii]|uniref:phage tail protein n=1 Tax=Bradyrhizobium barranii TaxID=2992140 RepID=UPI001AA1C869|nr:phage tail protein [Bradyrhizobium barranii]UPT95376.1 phage tail protein [Bradyrhizobium barranii subsp. apii]